MNTNLVILKTEGGTEVTIRDVLAFEDVRKSGVTNMFARNVVCELAGITKEVYMAIVECDDYSELVSLAGKKNEVDEFNKKVGRPTQNLPVELQRLNAMAMDALLIDPFASMELTMVLVDINYSTELTQTKDVPFYDGLFRRPDGLISVLKECGYTKMFLATHNATNPEYRMMVESLFDCGCTIKNGGFVRLEDPSKKAIAVLEVTFE